MKIPDPTVGAQDSIRSLQGKGGEVAKRSNAADCKSAGLRPSEVRILPSPPEAPPGEIAEIAEPNEPSEVVEVTQRPVGEGHWAGVAQLVEHQPSKLRVAGPSPVSRSIIEDAGPSMGGSC